MKPIIIATIFALAACQKPNASEPMPELPDSRCRALIKHYILQGRLYTLTQLKTVFFDDREWIIGAKCHDLIFEDYTQDD